MTDTRSFARRHMFKGLGAAAVVGWVWGVPRLPGLLSGDLEFSDIPGAPGFRRLEGATQLSQSEAIFVGLTAEDPAVLDQMNIVQANTCTALFGRNAAALPVALFSDFNCPNCPEMDANVAAVLAATPGTSLHRHELPLLGRTSEVASRAVLAADLQGQYAAMHDALLRTPAVTDLDLVRNAAAREGLDADLLLRDMARPEISTALARSKALSRHLGLYGTPAAVIGRTVLLGTKSQATIAAVIASEQERGSGCN